MKIKGLDPVALEAMVRSQRPALAYLIPTHQNPTGRVLCEADRQRIVELAAANPETLFVDDLTLAELGLTNDRAPRPLAALDPRLSNVVTIGSLSKTYWAGLRVGWVRAGADVIGKLAVAKAAADLGGASLPQAIAATLLATQHAEILRWRTKQLRGNLVALQAELSARLPSWSWMPPSGGLSLWVHLDSPAGSCDGGVFSQAALRKGIVVVPGRLLSTANRRRDWVRIAFTAPIEQLRRAVPMLAETWLELHSTTTLAQLATGTDSTVRT